MGSDGDCCNCSSSLVSFFQVIDWPDVADSNQYVVGTQPYSYLCPLSQSPEL